MTDYRALLLNSVASDPTRTLTLRNKWVADWNRRIKALKSVVLKAIVEQDVFGLKEQEHFLQVQEDLPVPEPRKFAYRYSQQKVEAFMAWLKEMESRSLLEIIQRPGTLRPEGEPWSNLYVRSAYQRGLEYARTNIASRSAEIAAGMGLKVPLPPSFKSIGAAISALLHQPFHADRLALAYTRVFDELKGVTSAMDQQISRELSKGIVQGLNPREIGESIGDRIDKIGKTRGTLIARTETINIHAQAALNEYYSAEKTTGEVILVQWKATHDSRVREQHLNRDMGVYTKEEAYALIGEPNCRCALLPYIPAIQGMPAKATAAARKASADAIGDLSDREKASLEKKVEKAAPEYKSDWESQKDNKSVAAVLKTKFSIERIIATDFADEKSSLEVFNKVGSELTRVLEQKPGIKNLLADTRVFTELHITGKDYLPDGKVGIYSRDSDSISLSNIKKLSRFKLGVGEGAFSIGDSFEDVLRHEWGHAIQFNRFNGEQYSKWIELFYKTTSSGIEQHVSLYAAASPEEAFAECFSAWTHADYGIKYKLPESIENFLNGLSK